MAMPTEDDPTGDRDYELRQYKNPTCKLIHKNLLQPYVASVKVRTKILKQLLSRVNERNFESRITCPSCKRDIYVKLDVVLHSDTRRLK